MLELLFVMALSIIGVVLAVLGVGMASGKKKPKMVELAERFETKAMSIATNAKNYDEKFVKKLDDSSILSNTVAAGVAVQGMYKAVTDSEGIHDFLGNVMGTAGNTIKAGNHPVRYMGSFGKFASNLAYGEYHSEKTDDIFNNYSSNTKAKKRTIAERERIKTFLENYARKEGRGEDIINIVETVNGGKDWGAFKDDLIKVPQYVNTPQGLHRLSDIELLNSYIHEKKEQELKKADNYVNEADVEARTMTEYRTNMDVAYKEGDTSKYQFYKSLLDANREYVLMHEEDFKNKLLKNPTIKKEMKDYIYDKYRDVA